MRKVAEADRIRRFMRALGDSSRRETRVYLTGGASAVLLGWRETTVDVDIAIVPDRDELFRVLPRLKDELALNIELASPSDFIPELPGWEDRSVFIAREGKVDFYHYDFHAQALAKIERGHVQDRADVAEMLGRELVRPETLRAHFEELVQRLHRYPALDERAFRRALEAALAPR
jgi:hypothetical protein